MTSFVVLVILKATLVSAVAFILSHLCRRARASVRHLLFALAFVALVAIPGAGPVLPAVAVTIPEAPIALGPPAGDMPAADSRADADHFGPGAWAAARAVTPVIPVTIEQVVMAVWAMGVLFFLMPVLVGSWQVRRLRQRALPWPEGQALVHTMASALGVRRRIDTLLHDAVTGPMTCGVLRASIILPAGARQWDEPSLRRALRHELEHVARWDFLTLCLSRVVCAGYWFHPAVWAAWRRLRLEAERACDEAVVVEDDAREYAALLISLARQGVTDGRRPVLAMAGRHDLAARVAALLDHDQPRAPLKPLRAAGLSVAAIVGILGVAPITVARAMPQAPPPSAPPAGAVSIKRNLPPQMNWHDGRLVATNVTLRELISHAFSVRDVENAPPWVRMDRFDITVSAPMDFVLDQGSKNLQSFLAERFKLVAHRASKEFPIYALVLARRDGSLGAGITRSATDCRVDRTCGMSTTHGRITGRGVTMTGLASHILIGSRTNSQVMDRELVDRTGLTGQFDVTIEWTPDVPNTSPQYRPFTSVLESSAPSLLKALEEQLGLKIESQLAPKPVLVIDSIEPPAGN